jgi:hypothetical protein
MINKNTFDLEKDEVFSRMVQQIDIAKALFYEHETIDIKE